jgi:hypothetical protein
MEKMCGCHTRNKKEAGNGQYSRTELREQNKKWQFIEDSPHAKEVCLVLVCRDVVPEGAVC